MNVNYSYVYFLQIKLQLDTGAGVTKAAAAIRIATSPSQFHATESPPSRRVIFHFEFFDPVSQIFTDRRRLIFYYLNIYEFIYYNYHVFANI